MIVPSLVSTYSWVVCQVSSITYVAIHKCFVTGSMFFVPPARMSTFIPRRTDWRGRSQLFIRADLTGGRSTEPRPYSILRIW